MIHDGLEALPRYRGLSQGLDVLIDWFAENEPADLPLGITPIAGERVYANVMNASTKRFEDARFETHHRYWDVQMDLDGAEDFIVTPGETVAAGEFDVETDKGYCHQAPGNDDLIRGTLDHGRFAVFVTDEPHMPNLAPEGTEPGPIKKICFKVVDDRFWDETPA